MFDNIKGFTLNAVKGLNHVCRFAERITDNLYKDLVNIIDK